MNDLIKDFVDTIKKSGLVEVVKELGEANVDKLLEEGSFKDIPALGTAAAMYNFGKTAKNKLLFRSINKFITNMTDIADEDRIKMFSKVESSTIDEINVSEFVMLSLERIDLPTKATCIAELFKDYLRNKISIQEFSRFCFIVEKMSLGDLVYVSKEHHRTGEHPNPSAVSAALGNGLFKIKPGPYISASKTLKYEPTPEGQKFGAILTRVFQ